MDDKVGRRFKLRNLWRQRKDIKTYRHLVTKFLSTHKQSVFASLLLILMVVLLFGIFSHFKAPVTSTAPSGVTIVDYSTFVGQVKAENVIGVSISGNEINALLAAPLTASPIGALHSTGESGVVGQGDSLGRPQTPAALSSTQRNADLAAWSHYISAGNSFSWSTTSSPPIDPARIIYTLSPKSGDAALSSLLLSNHVVVNTLPVAQVPSWLGVLWRFAPFLLLAVILLVMLAPRNGARSTRGMDDRITQIGKSRARRFEGVKEAAVPKSTSGGEPEKTKPPTDRKVLAPLAGARSLPSKARVALEPQVTFADVAGIDEVRTELEEIVEFLRNPGRFDRLGARIPRGALLVGPPGTGKTLLAKAVAGEAGVPFFSMSASEFVEMFVGVGASRVRDLFNQARQSSPCVVFIDEIDAVGRKRSMRITGNDERDQTLNQLLVELDGFDTRKAIVVLAATNRVDILDKALLRPGRFDRHITVSMPDRAGRQAILGVHTRRTPLHEDVSLERLARLTTGMTGADLANLVNEAALCAARRDLEQITHDCFEEALIRVQLGALRPIVMSETERRIIAYHEGGHALVAYHLPDADTVNRITILPRGQSLGVTQFIAEEDRYNYSRAFLMARIAIGLGGRVAEELTFGVNRVTTGAENDLQVVTDLARRMVTRWGMSEQVGVVFADYRTETGGSSLNMRRIIMDVSPLHTRPRSLLSEPDGQLVVDGDDRTIGQHKFAMAAPGAGNANSITLSCLIDSEVQRILNEGRAIARTILSEHSNQLQRLAAELMEREQLDRKQFEALFRPEA